MACEIIRKRHSGAKTDALMSRPNRDLAFAGSIQLGFSAIRWPHLRLTDVPGLPGDRHHLSLILTIPVVDKPLRLAKLVDAPGDLDVTLTIVQDLSQLALTIPAHCLQPVRRLADPQSGGCH